MTIIKIEKNENGSHNNQTISGVTPDTFPILDGYALLPEEVGTPDTLENYPFGDITVEEKLLVVTVQKEIPIIHITIDKKKAIGAFPVVTSWTPLPIPEPEPEARSEEPSMTSVFAAAKAFVAVATTLTDDQALEVQALVKTWDQALADGTPLEKGSILRKDGALYRVVQTVTPQAHQIPGGDGMLVIYRPIDQSHAGTKEDPIPWIYGMDCTTGLYYIYDGTVYLCKGDMIPCVWAPGTPGLWQWEEV